MATQLPKHIGVILFPGFQLLDLCGPLDVLNLLAIHRTLNLTILANTLDPVSTKHTGHEGKHSNFSEAIVPTHTFTTAPDDIEVLILPGGFGSRKEENIEGVVEFVKVYYPKVKYILTVCTGSAILAKTGVLDGRKATSNKKAFSWVREQNTAVHWVPKARWVVDGNIWTSSGISAGIDLIYAWIAEVWGEELASLLADSSEYERSTDASNDRFAERWGAV
ncbi:class I glutamine amidotransferase-like protein [Massarina eburnea CBS 473.64]|uniref:Class I glutamine amidotransferase-like protein n=1 Tax=Massarina eburnea CBS 473.64 TaxID=1395130 RepID=A0A6A6SES3_9PLEO|nr:class I glutamine amidotransferase-like protein [Massarina eburnea CBS 473.64]